MSIISQILEESSRGLLGYGIHENVAILGVDGEKRKKRDGSVMNSLFVVKYGQVEDGSVVNEREFITYIFKNDAQLEQLERNVKLNYAQMASILACYYTPAQVEEHFNPFASVGITDIKQLGATLSKKINMDAFNKAFKDMFINSVNNLVGAQSGFLFRLKVIISKTGYHDLPLTHFIEPMTIPLAESKLVLTETDEQHRAASLLPKKADNLAPGAPGAPTAPGVPGGMPGVPGAVPVAVPGSAPAAPAAQVNPLMAAAAAAPVQAAATAPAAPVAVAPTVEAALEAAPFAAPAAPSAPVVNNPLGGIPTLG